MENTIVIIFVILALIVGGVGGAVLTPNTTETKIEYRDKIVEVPVNVTVEKLVEVPAESSDMLSLAVDAFLIAVEDEEVENSTSENDADILGDFDFDEIEVSRVYKDYSVSYDGDKTTVDFSIKLKFDDDDSESNKVKYDVTVIFEEDDDTEVTVA